MEIFKDDILCGKYGPVIENVYHNYKVYANDNINDSLLYRNLDLTKQDYEIINKVILSYKYYDEMDMIKKTLSEEPCLKENLKEYNYIDKEKIKEYFSKNKRMIFGSFIPCI